MSTNKRYSERTLFWLCATVILFVGLGLRDPWPADEPRFMLVAKQMVESGNWLFPMRGDELYPDKPPVFMWIQALLYGLTGSVRIAFLLPSLVSGLIVLGLVRDLGRRLWSDASSSVWHVGAIASWLLLFAVMFTFQFKRAQIDPLITLWVTIGIWAFLRHYLERPSLALWCLAWAACGIGIITKGVGFLPLLVLPIAVWATRARWQSMAPSTRSPMRWLLGPVALVVPIALWLIPMATVAYGGNDPMFRAYADNILFKQTAGRYTNPWLHQQPWYYFIQVVLLQWLPVSLALPFVWRDWRTAWQQRDARILLPLLWVVLVVIFFSLSKGKREVYVLPALPMFCLAVAPFVQRMAAGKGLPRLVSGFNAVLIAFLLLGGAALAFGWMSPPNTLAGNAVPMGYVLLACGAAALGGSLLLRRLHRFAPLAATLSALWIGLSLFAYPLLNDDSSARGLMRDVAARIPADAELGLVAWKEQNLLMRHNRTRTFGFLRPPLAQWQDAAAWAQEQPSQRWLLSERKALPQCMQGAQADFMGVYNRRYWYLVPATHACAASAQEMRDVELDRTKGFEGAFE